MFTNFEDAVQNAELIIECVEEDLQAKMTLFESKDNAVFYNKCRAEIDFSDFVWSEDHRSVVVFGNTNYVVKKSSVHHMF